MKKHVSGFTGRVLMIRPYQFHKNEQTAQNNYYQKDADYSSVDRLTRAAQDEFDGLVQVIRRVGVEVVVHEDTNEFVTPDSLFPNNWVSFHPHNEVVLYPMYAENRRKERHPSVWDSLAKAGVSIKVKQDYSPFEQEGVFLEGTGSMVLDRAQRIAYAALSERTDPKLFVRFCADHGYEAHSFRANQTVGGRRLPIYHTNVMMSIGPSFAIVGLDTIDDNDERLSLIEKLEKSGKTIISLTEEQIERFAGNMLTLLGSEGPVLVMSSSAFNALNDDQKARLEKHAQLVHSPLDTIERCGGGSARCMLAEIF